MYKKMPNKFVQWVDGWIVSFDRIDYEGHWFTGDMFADDGGKRNCNKLIGTM